MCKQVRQRYQRGSIYTFVGSILVAVNPYKALSIYGVDVMQTVRQISRSGGALPPHVFSVLATAFDRMLQDNYNQTILISGMMHYIHLL
jgi:myosin heavy subunit